MAGGGDGESCGVSGNNLTVRVLFSLFPKSAIHRLGKCCRAPRVVPAPCLRPFPTSAGGLPPETPGYRIVNRFR